MASDLARLREWCAEQENVTSTARGYRSAMNDVVLQIDDMLAASPAPDAEAPEIVVTERMVEAGARAGFIASSVSPVAQEIDREWWDENSDPQQEYRREIRRRSARACIEAALRAREG